MGTYLLLHVDLANPDVVRLQPLLFLPISAYPRSSLFTCVWDFSKNSHERLYLNTAFKNAHPDTFPCGRL